MSCRLLICAPVGGSTMGGVSLAVELFVEHLRNNGVSVKVVDAMGGRQVKKTGSFSLLRALDSIVVVLRVWLGLFSADRFYATMSTSSLGFIRDFLAVLFARFLRRPVFLHLHGGGFEDFYQNSSPFLRSMIRANLSRTNRIIVLGKLLRNQFDCVSEVAASKLVVVQNGLTKGVEVKISAFKTISYGQPIRLLYMSSLMESKGYLDVLNALRHLNEKEGTEFHLDLCGLFVSAKTEAESCVSSVKELKLYIKDLGIEDCVTYHGQVVGNKKSDLYKRAHVFLLPTYYPWEGQPLSLIEAAAFAMPIISCAHKGIPEIVLDGVSGTLVPARNPKAIALAVSSIVESPERYASMSRSAARHFEANFTREVHLSRLTEVVISDSLHC